MPLALMGATGGRPEERGLLQVGPAGEGEKIGFGRELCPRWIWGAIFWGPPKNLDLWARFDFSKRHGHL